MSISRPRCTGIIIALTAALALFAALAGSASPALGQVETYTLVPADEADDSVSQATVIPDPQISRSLTYSLGAWALTVGALYAMDASQEDDSGGPYSLVLLGGLAATGWAAARGASTSAYRVNPLGPMGGALVGMAGSAVLFGMGWEQDSGALIVASGITALIAPPVLATVTAQWMGSRKAESARSQQMAARPTIGRTPEGQTAVGLRVALPHH
jgi:hypothetical protein